MWSLSEAQHGNDADQPPRLRGSSCAAVASCGPASGSYAIVILNAALEVNIMD